MHFMDAVKYVGKKDGCTDERAVEHLVTAIVDQALAAQWGGDLGLEPVIPSEFTGILKICLDGVGSVKRNRETAKAKSITRWTGNYPKLEFVNGPVFDDFKNVPLTENAPDTEVSNLNYIPLLVLKETMDRWPLEDSITKVRNTGNQARIERSSPPSTKQILEVARKVYRENQTRPPNLVKVQPLIRKELPGATRKLMLPILKSAEFDKQRRRSGKQPN